MNTSAKITAKGQITLPKKLRNELGLKPGDRIDFNKNAKGNYEIVTKRYTLDDLRGMIKLDGPPRSIDQIMQDIEAAKTSRANDIARRMTREKRK